MSLSVAQNLRESLFLPKAFPHVNSSFRGSSSPRLVHIVRIRSSAVRGKTTKKKRFDSDSVERTYAKKGSYFRRKDDVVQERETMRGTVNRSSTQVKSAGYFKIYRVEVLLERDLGKDYFDVSDGVLEATAAALGCEVSNSGRNGEFVVSRVQVGRQEQRIILDQKKLE